MLDFNLNKNCYGCTACTNICPKNAIQMEENSEGFLIPRIDENKCIKCMLCDKSCSYLNSNDNELSSPKQIFSLYRKNPSNNISTSSGIFYDLATSIILSGGYVCGCIWNDSMEAVHIITDNIKMLDKMRGSKYVQSNLNDIFIKIKKILLEGKVVLFSGTACQIKGLKLFLKNQYENLYTIQIVCHSVGSPKVLRKYISYMNKKYSDEIVDINFRAKDKDGWLTPISKYYFKSGFILEKASYINDEYFVGFGKSLFDRECCHNCQFKNNFQISDIIIGDNWGCSTEILNKSKNLGVSLVILNTQKAIDIFANVKDKFEFKSISLEEAVRENKYIIEPIESNINKLKFMNSINKLTEGDFPTDHISDKGSRIKYVLYKLRIFSNIKMLKYKLNHRRGR